ncbi:MAG TPA: amidohydrolase family protein [candidate division Zixibacteria bacterium]|nr:amidohydrolase family protein [candidate division Zixibacteria bacterium]
MELRDALKVLDSDAHARDTDDAIRPYLDAPYRNQTAPFLPRETYDRNLGGTLGHSGAKVEERLAAMDRQEIDTAVIYPTSGLGIGRIRDPKFNAALCRAYNNYIAEYCKASPRLKAVANLPVNNPAECPRELNRAVTQLGLCGGMLAAQAHSKNLGSPEFYPLYEEAQRLNTPIAIHAFGGDEPGSEIFDQFICLHTTGHPFPVLRQLTAMIFAGIPEKFPNLRIGYLEIGCGWIPYWMERMDEEWEKRGKVEAPLCKRKPSEYLTGGNIYYGCEPEEKMMGYVVREIGSKTLMYASDYPHWDMSWPESAVIVWRREDLSPDAKKDILVNNARRFYNLN